MRRWLPSGWVKRECGKTVWRRSIAVGVVFPAMYHSDPNAPGACNACAGITFLISKNARGWIVWGQY